MPESGHHARPITLDSYFYGTLPDEELNLTVLPHLMGQFHYDKYDVRSGTKHSDELCLAIPLDSPGMEITCTPDDILAVRRELLHSLPQKSLKLDLWNGAIEQELFQLLEDSFLEFICRHFRIRIFRNFELGIFSRYNEPRELFEARCRERAEELLHHRLPEIKSRYDRQLEQFKNRYLMEYHHVAGREASTRQSPNDLLYSHFLRVREQMTNIFSRFSYLSDDIASNMESAGSTGHELQEDLDRLLKRAWNDILDLAVEYRPVVSSIESYSISLAKGELVLDQIALLWRPQG
jgi:hypothetical protein